LIGDGRVAVGFFPVHVRAHQRPQVVDPPVTDAVAPGQHIPLVEVVALAANVE